MSYYAKKNNARSTIQDVDGITASATEVTINSSDISKFPADGTYFNITIWNKNTYPLPDDDPNMEIIKVTGVNGSTFTIERAQEGTTASAHEYGDAVWMLLTAGMLEEYETAIDSKLSSDNDIDLGTHNLRATEVQLEDDLTLIKRDASGNLVLEDNVSGSYTLASILAGGNVPDLDAVATQGASTAVDLIVGNVLNLGDGTDENILIYANNGDSNKPALKYDSVNNVWQYSNNGTDFNDMGSGGGTTYTMGDGLQETSGNVLSVDYNTINLKITSGELNTIQDISSSSSPTFSSLTIDDVLISKNTDNICFSDTVGLNVRLSEYAPVLSSTETNEVVYVSKYLIVAEKEDIDYSYFGTYYKRPSSTPSYPYIRVYDENQVPVQSWIQMYFDGDGVISTGSGRLYFNPISPYITFGVPDGSSAKGSLGFQYELRMILDSDSSNVFMIVGENQRLYNFGLSTETYPTLMVGGSDNSGTTDTDAFINFRFNTVDDRGVIETDSGNIFLDPYEGHVIFDGSLDFTDSNTQIWVDGNDLKFKDVNTGTKTLAQLASGGGGSTIEVRENGTIVDSVAEILNFSTGLDVSDDSGSQVTITVDLSEISGYNNTNWDTAYSWGDHSTQGYITASSTDTFTNKSGNISMWTNDSGYLTSESDTLDTVLNRGASSSVDITIGDILKIGDGTTGTNKLIQANNGDSNLPTIRYNETSNAWEYSNNGVDFTNLITNEGTIVICAVNENGLEAGDIADIYCPYGFTIIGVVLLADQSGTLTWNIYKTTYSSYDGSDGTSIIGSGTKPNLSASTKYKDTTLTNWTTSVSADDTLRFEIESVNSGTTTTSCSLILIIEKE